MAKSQTTFDISSVTKLEDVFKIIQDSGIPNFIDSITFNIKNQKIIFKMQELLKEESESLPTGRQTATEDITRLSESYRDKYPELLSQFKIWKKSREELIKNLKISSYSIERNASFVSGFRIFTSAADIFGTIFRSGGKPENSWSDVAMEHASTLGIVALFLEMTLSKKMQSDVNRAINEDRENFKKIAEWFRQTEELDTAIKSFFPYGIDTSVVDKINSCASDFDDYNKIFMVIYASNVKGNQKLFQNMEFLDRADLVASSEAGKQWFHTVILKNDPYFQHCLNATLCSEIQAILKASPTENHEICVDACNALHCKVGLKVVLNLMTIISATSNLLYGPKSEIADTLENLSKTTEKELAEIKKVVKVLKPSCFELDPILE